MKKQPETMEGVKLENAALKENEFVKLSQLYSRLKMDKQRKVLAQLRCRKKHGMELAAKGVTPENMADYVEAEMEAVTDSEVE